MDPSSLCLMMEAWSKPFERRDSEGNLVGLKGKSLVNLSGNGIGMAADIRADVPKGQGRKISNRNKAHSVFWRSEDGGETWEAPVPITPRGYGAFFFRDTLARTSSGRILLPVYVTFGQGAKQAGTLPFSGKPLQESVGLNRRPFLRPEFHSCLRLLLRRRRSDMAT